MPHNRWMLDDRHPTALRAASAVAAMTALMLLAAALGRWVVIPSTGLAAFDEGVAARGPALLANQPWLADLAAVWSDLSGPWVVHPLVLVVAVFLTVRHRVPPTALFTVPIGLVGWALGAWCKEIVQRPRPMQAVIEVDSWSYPSGHASNIALGAVLLIILCSSIRTAWLRRTVVAVVLLVAALTAADRIVLGVHYVSDVTVGLALGAAMALVAVYLLDPLHRRPSGDLRSSGDGPARSSTPRRQPGPTPRA